MERKLSSESLKLLCQASFSCREEMQHLNDKNMALRQHSAEIASNLEKYQTSLAAGVNSDGFHYVYFQNSTIFDKPSMLSPSMLLSTISESRKALVTNRLEIEDNERQIDELDRLMELYDEDAIAFGIVPEPTSEASAAVNELLATIENPLGDLLNIKTRILVKGIACDVQEVFLKVQEIVVSLVSMEKQQVEADTFLHDDVGMDDLDFVDLILRLQEEFDCCIRTADVHGWRTVGDVVRTVMNNSKVAH